MAIYVITGKPRQGKTYYLARQALKWIKNGERIYSNIWLNLNSPLLAKYYAKNDLSAAEITGDMGNDEDLKNERKQVFFWRNIREWNRMTNGIIIADEGTRYFNPRRWSMLTEETELKLQQHGHEDLDIWLTTQHYTRLDITLRVLVERFLEVRKIIGPIGNSRRAWGLLKITEHYLEDMERLDRALEPEEIDSITIYREFRLLRKKYAEFYNTREMVGRSLPPDLHHDEVWCEDDDCPVHGRKAGKPKIVHS